MRGALIAPLLWLGLLGAAAAQPHAASIDANQISSPQRGADVGASQIGAAGTGLTATGQLTQTKPTSEAAPSLSTPGQGRNTAVAAVKGHDHCDPAAGHSAAHPDCAHIIDNRGAEFANQTPDQAAPAVHADASSDGLVDDVVNGGTGTVVVLQGK